MTKEQAREAMDNARDERDAAIAAYDKISEELGEKQALIAAEQRCDEAQQKYIEARDYYTSKFPRHV